MKHFVDIRVKFKYLNLTGCKYLDLDTSTFLRKIIAGVDV